MKKYYYAGGERIAMRTGSSTVNFLLGDHLGSTSVVADTSGIRANEVRYKPWGTDRYVYGTAAEYCRTPTSIRFTGQRTRELDWVVLLWGSLVRRRLGRFIQADTVVPNPGSGHVDSYAYVRNNPVNRSSERACFHVRICPGNVILVATGRIPPQHLQLHPR